MRQILILKSTKEDKTVIVNLPDTDTYTVSLDLYPLDSVPLIEGAIRVKYAHKEVKINLMFEDSENAADFKSSLIEYMTNGCIPIMAEDNEQEIRYWMEFDVLEVT